ncbi:APG9-domain-containing protein [Gloeophyllum trabeum ATCC 11539]|uniref:Autophagy-related protein 9 n=1 Tax=Gloeophyllum trabeum (strain ATCC 11539 / FP-39264 / Madison 617) TaxID=670483 RepID=S7QEK5_GLOTA|nr:APG9-domain-containing protein [Gloeophyllum trabeum ATCC 11539]EPQ57867.1 APG9-domain-containing protein [Gloeophyllum trabeum ATCC 11539]
MLNPMGRAHMGYMQANQSVLEEEENETERERDDDDLEAGRRTSAARKAHGKRRVSWGADASEMNVLRPNIRQNDKIDEQRASDDDDEVPQDFLIEAAGTPPGGRRSSQHGKGKARDPATARPPLSSFPPQRATPVSQPHRSDPPVPAVSIPPRPSETTPEETFDPPQSPPPREPRPMRGLDAYERALWNWVNVYNLDAFLQEVYAYYEGKGIYCIALERGLNLLTVGFVIAFSTFLLGCVDYSRIKPEGITRLSDVVVDRCVSRFSGFTFLFFLLFSAFYCWQVVSYVMDVVRLVDMYNFYTHLLRIPDEDIQTISWPEIVRRIGGIRDENPLTAISSKSSAQTAAKLDAHTIANRIMRQENYLIALFNKELLDLRVPLPSALKRFVPPEQGKGRTLTRALEWNLRFSLMEYLFDPSGRVRKVFLKSKNREVLIQGLRRRLIFMGILNAVFAPFIVLYLLMYSFFRYFEEYHKNPSTIGGRRYTPFAEWKFREFNELPHIFQRRLDESYPVASMYIGQFPNEKIALIMRFVAFIAGSFAAVLILASVIDPDLFLGFEVTPHRTVLFYIGLFGSVLAVARGMIPAENFVFDPEALMTEVVQYTHYMPDHWKNQLHSKKVHQEFGELFALKIVIFAKELLSVVLTPFILWFSLPDCAPEIIDFFRTFTIHVDGIGYICSFAQFNFEKHGNVKFGAPSKVNDERLMSKDGKMEKSFLNFKAANPTWNPADPSGSMYLSRMADYRANQLGPLNRRRQPWLGASIALDATVHMSKDHKPDLAARAQEYDRALLQSQALARQRHGSTVLAGAGSTVDQGQGPSSSSIFRSGIAGMETAQTMVLGDSQGSRVLSPPVKETDDIHEEDLAPDGGVGSGLGGSYVDGAVNAQRTRPYASGSQSQERQEEEDGLEDAGVLGLLAQIYGTRVAGPGRVI